MAWTNPALPLSFARFPFQIFGTGWYRMVMGRMNDDGSLACEVYWDGTVSMLPPLRYNVPKTFKDGKAYYPQAGFAYRLSEAWLRLPVKFRQEVTRYLRRATLAAFLALTEEDLLYVIHSDPHYLWRPNTWLFDYIPLLHEEPTSGWEYSGMWTTNTKTQWFRASLAIFLQLSKSELDSISAILEDQPVIV